MQVRAEAEAAERRKREAEEARQKAKQESEKKEREALKRALKKERKVCLERLYFLLNFLSYFSHISHFVISHSK